MESLYDAPPRPVTPPATTLFAISALTVTIGFLMLLSLHKIVSLDDKILRPEGTLPIFYNTFQIFKHKDDLYDWVTSQNELRGGRPWKLQMIGRPATILVTTPELVEDVLVTQFENFGKGEFIGGILRDLLGDGIFAVDGPKWVQQRKTASNLFSQRALRDSMAIVVDEHAHDLVEVLQRHVAFQQPVDMFKLFNRFTFEVFAEIGFGVKIGDLKNKTEAPFQSAFDAAQRLLLKRFLEPSWVWKTKRYLNVGTERELKSCIQLIDDTVYGIISQSMTNQQNSGSSSVSGRKDIIALFLDEVSYDTKSESKSKQLDGFDPKFLRDVVVNFLMAGRDTTAQALSWFLYCVSQNPSAEQTIREELAAKLPGFAADDGDETASPTTEQLHQLVYLEAAIKETLRLYPSVPDNGKTALRDTVLCDGTFVKAGWEVGTPGYSLGRITHVWGPDAKEYKPERWIDSETGKLTPVSAFKFNAFHAGPRMCLGMNLAMMEMKTVAAVLLSKFRFELVPGQEIAYDLSITLPIKGALMMNVTPNAPSAH